MNDARQLSTMDLGKHLATAAAIIAATLLAGCTGDATQGSSPSKEQVGTATQALSGANYAAQNVTINEWGDTEYIDMGVGAGFTCWVAGVWGNMQDGSYVYAAQNDTGYPPSIPGGNWMLVIGGNPGTQIGGSVACGFVTDLATPESNPILSASSDKEWCGLWSVSSSSSSDWSSTSSFAKVANDDGGVDKILTSSTWDFTESSATASPSCAALPGTETVDEFKPFSVNPSSPSPKTFTSDSSLAMCFLTGLRGDLQGDDDWSAGGGWSVVWHDGGSSTWTLTASSGVSVGGLCIE